MPYLLDTNHWIQLLKGRCPALARRLDTVAPEEVWLCSVVKEELFHGAQKYGNREARLARLRELFSHHGSVPFDDVAAEEAGRLRHVLETSGTVLGPHDLQIAAIARTRGWILVTNNLAEFQRVDALALEDWTKD
ncbi:MAG: type II toxin-antitoxin system VapC family toxin [Verrucomicrobiales bacterium]|nr:type II toxin-antitoxin system VapC family toxin [Verrucomicrobiales bacterium]